MEKKILSDMHFIYAIMGGGKEIEKKKYFIK